MKSVTRSKAGWTAALALALACGPATASGQQSAAPTATRAPDPCADAQTQLALTECADRQYREADAALNAAYRPLLAALDEPHRERLTAAQRAWITFRDAECRLAASVALGGSMERQLELACRKDMTQGRVKELASIRESLAESMP
jgi:uncharacterized protein YecT (DUF1311 family)